jgi:hypothetical protein
MHTYTCARLALFQQASSPRATCASTVRVQPPECRHNNTTAATITCPISNRHTLGSALNTSCCCRRRPSCAGVHKRRCTNCRENIVCKHTAARRTQVHNPYCLHTQRPAYARCPKAACVCVGRAPRAIARPQLIQHQQQTIKDMSEHLSSTYTMVKGRWVQHTCMREKRSCAHIEYALTQCQSISPERVTSRCAGGKETRSETLP